uniref:Exostosin GT47 domain-containing protein n=1 Tax=Mucochytrium quahogii TaxID=96639 RepID=A0A7S2RRK8_9STRA|mmetsp:Transcript_13303/g.21742  ORF Transcript_13303/g.21742 Transcript_13303/m.21742 type:complete len:449 (+) Transcript_13303:21-1367(+)|eukprot:CAMPEP_0203753720 /NCGR_PEP_ID=MMETSP0098-20131031/7442_1 /ASSEMBLY_ACC=CAM_ASM_000208 /TAXON_ID=96639 /ORGANISM=" , Strain NY0313808BC1" /LENGTH=448 /DNA_ID=CAMNT_0050644429 /DNA_START=22 /DNA_END=1368 /DNA_ORIENTATION=-
MGNKRPRASRCDRRASWYLGAASVCFFVCFKILGGVNVGDDVESTVFSTTNSLVQAVNETLTAPDPGIFVVEKFKIYVPDWRSEDTQKQWPCLKTTMEKMFAGKKNEDKWLHGDGSYFEVHYLLYEMLLQSRFRVDSISDADCVFIPVNEVFECPDDVEIEVGVVQWVKHVVSRKKPEALLFVVSPHAANFWELFQVYNRELLAHRVWYFSTFNFDQKLVALNTYNTMIPPIPLPSLVRSWSDCSLTTTGCPSADQRGIDFYFQGSSRRDPVRIGLIKLFNTSSRIGRGTSIVGGKTSSKLHQLKLMQSRYCFAPRGDNPFSQHFTNAIAAGCVPVVVSDFLRLFDWSPGLPLLEFVVRLPEHMFTEESKYRETEAYLDRLANDHHAYSLRVASLLKYREYFIPGYGVPFNTNTTMPFRSNEKYQLAFVQSLQRAYLSHRGEVKGHFR